MCNPGWKSLGVLEPTARVSPARLRRVPLLDFQQNLPHVPQRVLVAGTAASGKTTLAIRVAQTLGTPHVEIDSLYHGPNWTPRPSFVGEVEQFSAQPRWVTEWQYAQVRTMLADRADLVVWLDLPRLTVMRQVIRRTIRRRWHRETLWNHNIEPPLWTILTDEEHIVRWAWSTHSKTTIRVRELLRTRPELPVVRLRSHHEAARWLDGPLAATAT
jgi:adenylate kinase family enzyme